MSIAQVAVAGLLSAAPPDVANTENVWLTLLLRAVYVRGLVQACAAPASSLQVKVAGVVVEWNENVAVVLVVSAGGALSMTVLGFGAAPAGVASARNIDEIVTPAMTTLSNRWCEPSLMIRPSMATPSMAFFPVMIRSSRPHPAQTATVCHRRTERKTAVPRLPIPGVPRRSAFRHDRSPHGPLPGRNLTAPAVGAPPWVNILPARSFCVSLGFRYGARVCLCTPAGSSPSSSASASSGGSWPRSVSRRRRRTRSRRSPSGRRLRTRGSLRHGPRAARPISRSTRRRSGSTTRRNRASIASHIAAMRYAGLDAGIASWWGRRTPTDSRIPLLLKGASGTPFRWALYYEQEGYADPTVSQLTGDLDYIAAHYGTDRSYLRVNGKPVIFAYGDATDACGMVDRWTHANAGRFYVVLKVFPGYRTCANQPASWHQYAPAAASDSQAGYSYSISPGFYKKGEAAPRLTRDPARWAANVRAMISSEAPWQLVTTFNEWGEGTAVESAQEWASKSGYGTYLDTLHRYLVGSGLADHRASADLSRRPPERSRGLPPTTPSSSRTTFAIARRRFRPALTGPTARSGVRRSLRVECSLARPAIHIASAFALATSHGNLGAYGRQACVAFPVDERTDGCHRRVVEAQLERPSTGQPQ